MRVVHVIDILLEYLAVLAFGASLVGALFWWKALYVAGGALLFYILWGLIRLRCPWCRSSVELWTLLRGVRRGCHCPHCGHEITVVWWVSHGKPRKLRRAERARQEEPEQESESESE